MGNSWGSAKPGFIILICGIMGLIIAAIEQLAYDNEFIFHLYLEAAELPGLQILTIIIFLIAGAVLAAITS